MADSDAAKALWLVAKWDTKHYTVTFDLSDANADAATKPADVTAADNLQWGGAVSLQQGSSDPTSAGRAFAGWKVTDRNGTAIQKDGADYVVAAGTASKLFSELALADTDDTAALTLVAQWTDVSDYAVTFLPFAPSETGTATHMPADKSGLKWGDPVSLRDGSDKPARAGYTFAGWDVYKVDPSTAGAAAIGTVGKDDASKAYSAMADSDAAKALWLVAKWDTITYTIHFADGATSGNTSVTATPNLNDKGNLKYTDTGIALPTVTRPGYTFGGWSNSVNSAKGVSATATTVDYANLVDSDADTEVTLTAIWTANKGYKVTYSDGVTSGTAYTGTVLPADRTDIAYDANDVKHPDLAGGRTGYDFRGWKVTNDVTGAQIGAVINSNYATDSIYYDLAGDPDVRAITLTAVWEAKSFGVTYHLTDGSWQTANITDIPAGKTADDKISVKADITYAVRAANTVSRPGYTLTGWQTAPNGGTKYEFAGTSSFTMPAADVDLYPIWVARDYAVKFEGNEPVGTAAKPADQDPVKYDQHVAYSDATLAGYDFKGWNVYKTDEWTANGASATPLRTGLTGTSGATVTYESLAGDPDIASLTFVAQWDAKTFYLQYHSGASAAEAATWHTDKISADQMGAMHNADNPIYYKTNATVSLRSKDSLTVDGKRLKGWKDGTDAGAKEYRFDTTVPFTLTMPAANVNLYPIWETVADYTVTFEDGLSAIDPAKVASGAAVQNLPYATAATPNKATGLSWTSPVSANAPTLAGWKFTGWTVYDNATPKAVIKSVVAGTHPFNTLALADTDVRHDLTLVANWELVKTYAVKFLDGVAADEKTPVSSKPADLSGLAFTDAVNHAAATRKGYTFEGWGVKAYGATGDPIALADVAAGTTAYNLLTGAAPGNPAYLRLELTAKWAPKAIYKVSFKGQPDSDKGGTAVVDLPADLSGLTWESDVAAGSVTPAAPTRKGYRFDHWAIQDITKGTDAANIRNIGRCGLGTYQYSALAADNDAVEHVLLTAVWVANTWKVTYVDESGKGSWVADNIPEGDKAHPGTNAGTYKVDEDVAVRGTDVMTRTGYDLLGWATTSAKAAAGTADAADFKMPDADVTLYAVWAARTYTVHFLENKPAAATDALQTVQGMPETQTGDWTFSVDTKHPTLAGYVFRAWAVKDAAALGAKSGELKGTTYKYDALAIDDGNTEITLVALWDAAPYRLIYVDPTDADGAAAPVQLKNDATLAWDGTVSIDDPWTVAPSYVRKSTSDWRFDGWTITLADGTVAKLAATDDLTYGAIAARTGLTVADVADLTPSDTPALTLTAAWTRRVPFVVDFVKVAADGTKTVMTADAQTLTGFDGDSIARVWADTVLDLGGTKSYKGYRYNRVSSAAAPEFAETLSASQLGAGNELHLQLLFEAITDYVVTYDADGIVVADDGSVSAATGAYLKSDLAKTKHVATAPSPAWDTPASNFAPVDSDWAKTGYRIDHWYYVDAAGNRHDFAADMTFAQIAAAIYGEDALTGEEGIADAAGAVTRPVTLLAAWVMRNDYKVVYDDNFTTDYTTTPESEGYIKGKFIPADSQTPADKENVGWDQGGLEPADASVITNPGYGLAKDDKSLYELDGWNYSTDGGRTQYAAEGKTFSEIAAAIYGADEPEGAEIRLYARWKEIEITLHYQPVAVNTDADGNVVLTSGEPTVTGNGGGTVSRSSEQVYAVSGGTLSGTKLVAEGATAQADPGYHFVGWRRESDHKVIYAAGMDPATMRTMSTMSAASVATLFAMADATGYNTLDMTSVDAQTAFQAAQNVADGYWHDETYQALFAKNAIAVLTYDKNAEDAEGTIADVEEPEGTVLTLSDGSGFKRTNWTLVGWNEKADGTGKGYELSEEGFVMPEGGDTLYAMWKKNPATLTYDPGADDVTGTPDNITDEWGTTVEVSDGTPTRSHHKFLGWNTKEDGTGEWVEAGTEIELVPEGVTLYGQWEINKYGVTAGEPTEGGTLRPYDPIEIEHGGRLPEGYLTADPEDGWHIDGWTYTLIDENGRTWTGKVDDPSDLDITGTVTFTPVFAKDSVEKPAEPTGTATARTAVAGQAPATLPQTGDEGLPAATLIVLTGMGLTLILLAVFLRRRDDEDEEERA